MADDKAEESYALYDAVYITLAVLAAAGVALIAADVFTQGAVSEWLAARVRPKLAAVIPIKPAEGESDDAAG